MTLALGSGESPTRSSLETLLAYLKKKTLLLILDNCEHVIGDAAAVVDAISKCCPGIRILATSRESLKVEGERSHPAALVAGPGTRGRACT